MNDEQPMIINIDVFQEDDHGVTTHGAVITVDGEVHTYISKMPSQADVVASLSDRDLIPSIIRKYRDGN